MVALFGHYASAASSSRPNVLFIISDDQDLLMNSMDYMPNVKRLIGDNGVTFPKHYCTSAFCYFHADIDSNTNITDVAVPWGGYPKFITQGFNEDYLPLWLQEGGINTYYVGKFANAHKVTNYLDPPCAGWTGSNFLLEPGVYDYLNTSWAKDNGPWSYFLGEHAINVTTNHALDMLDTAVNGGEPWFLTVAPAVPHVGINASNGEVYFPIAQPEWADAFPDAKVPRTPNWNPTEPSGVSFLLDLPYQNQTIVDELDELYRARLRVVAGLDVMVSQLIEALDKYGVLDNTHVIYTTDNGYHISQHRLGCGKKEGYETDINIPFVWRGPGIPRNETSKSVSTHTDLAPTFLKLFGLPQRTRLDGQIIPLLTDDKSSRATEHVNIELWGAAAVYETKEFRSIKLPANVSNNTYKGLRIIADDYSLYYSVWCTNEHELYDMVNDYYQMDNLLPDTTDINNVPSGTYLDRPLSNVVARLDALMMVLKTCVGIECTKPWLQLHPQGNVQNLQDALDEKYDAFYSAQPHVSFSACKMGYLAEYEGPTGVMQYGGDSSYGYGQQQTLNRMMF
ncbi:hypothetical protein N7510_009565 [Penicillium lagena]|uniref:uncharacterized protein n=1 Tax=Penicillium lagena TaxID=94218 RepID=UPI002541A189|nr:uncharacterized protein N7510_009565 [Penicillium lagena]KAJ5604411.1 hypothetical protein N7510_009565 [Penicillium lagena]